MRFGIVQLIIYVHLLMCTAMTCSRILKFVKQCVSTPIRVYVNRMVKGGSDKA